MKYNVGDIIIWNPNIKEAPNYVDKQKFYIVGVNGIECLLDSNEVIYKYYSDLTNFISMYEYCSITFNISVGSQVTYKGDIIRVVEIRKWGTYNVEFKCDDGGIYFQEALIPISVIRNNKIDEILE